MATSSSIPHHVPIKHNSLFKRPFQLLLPLVEQIEKTLLEWMYHSSGVSVSTNQAQQSLHKWLTQESAISCCVVSRSGAARIPDVYPCKVPLQGWQCAFMEFGGFRKRVLWPAAPCDCVKVWLPHPQIHGPHCKTWQTEIDACAVRTK